MRAVSVKEQCDWLIRHGEDLNEILSKPGGDATFAMVIEYIFISEADKNKVIKALQHTPPIIEKRAMSVAEQFEKQGEELGKKLGRSEERFELIKRMLENGASVKQIAELTGLKLSEIQEIEKALDASWPIIKTCDS